MLMLVDDFENDECDGEKCDAVEVVDTFDVTVRKIVIEYIASSFSNKDVSKAIIRKSIFGHSTCSDYIDHRGGWLGYDDEGFYHKCGLKNFGTLLTDGDSVYHTKEGYSVPGNKVLNYMVVEEKTFTVTIESHYNEIRMPRLFRRDKILKTLHHVRAVAKNAPELMVLFSEKRDGRCVFEFSDAEKIEKLEKEKKTNLTQQRINGES